MPRKARIEFPGALYHVLDRGDRREAIFADEEDRLAFLRTLEEVCRRTGWWVHAYVLMSNHYHLLLETPEANLVAGMKWFQSTYTLRFNRRHRQGGHLFQGRYKAIVVDPEERNYLLSLSDYIHLNPVRAGLLPERGKLFDYRWNSYPAYVKGGALSPWWLKRERVLGEQGWSELAADRRQYAERMKTPGPGKNWLKR
jgi:putative transposase